MLDGNGCSGGRDLEIGAILREERRNCINKESSVDRIASVEARRDRVVGMIAVCGLILSLQLLLHLHQRLLMMAL